MKEVNIKGKIFTEDEVSEYGKKAIIKNRKTLLWIGLVLLVLSVFFSILLLVSVLTDNLVIPESFISIFMFGSSGIVLIIASFIEKKKDPYTSGINFLNKHFPYSIGFDGNIIAVLQGDKTIKLSKNSNFQLIISSVERKFQIVKDGKHSKILTGKDVLEYEIKVDNEVIVTSNSKAKRGVGKALVGGALFGGAGMIAGAVAGNKKTKTTQYQKEIHHYILTLKVNDILSPSFVVELESLQIAEEVTATLAIICQSDNITEDAEEIVNENKLDKFEELKKYKELLDAGIITQEEFKVEKEKILR